MKKQEKKWHQRFLKQAYDVASWSKDKSTKVGAVIVDDNRAPRSYGFNGFPRKVNDNIKNRHERPVKYKYTEHAERNALYHCARVGIPTEGCTIYITHYPCSDCARGIIQSGIKRVVVAAENMTDDMKERWGDDFVISEKMFKEAKVEVIVL